jgi:hypothetical protein
MSQLTGGSGLEVLEERLTSRPLSNADRHKKAIRGNEPGNIFSRLLEDPRKTFSQ